MGWGDELIATGQARELQERNSTKRKVIVRDRLNRIREHEIWRNNPRICTKTERPFSPIDLQNGPGTRPYIAGKTEHRWIWRDFTCPRGEIYFSHEELAFAEKLEPGVVIEPNIKGKASPNKDWGAERWGELIRLARGAGIKPTQLGPVGTRLLPGCRFIETPTFRHACAALARARAAVLTEGGLHHAAAALGVRSIVIFGGFISPKQTGYATQTNFFTGGEPCGMRVPCKHCAEAMAAINPAAVFAALQEFLRV